MTKLLSGRFIFTIVAASIFFNLSINGLIDSKDAVQLITLIAVFYFTRTDRKGE